MKNIAGDENSGVFLFEFLGALLQLSMPHVILGNGGAPPLHPAEGRISRNAQERADVLQDFGQEPVGIIGGPLGSGFYLANRVEMKTRSADGSVYFELELEDAWVWDMFRPARFVKRVRVMTFRDVNIEETDIPSEF